MKVIQNKKIKKDVFLLTIKNQEIATSAQPGQFVQIKVTNSYIPLLRRPFSIHHAANNNFKILYKVVGTGTQLLSQYKTGQEIDMIGPLGKGFNTKNYEKLTLVAGGMGIAPLYFLAETEKDKDLTTLIGTATEEELLGESEFKTLGKVLISTEDGSSGKKGRVTDLLEEIEKPEIIIACGPVPMLEAIQKYAIKNNIPCQMSLECHMACGMGICFGCAVKSGKGYKYVCKDGPVFWATDIEI